MTCSSGGGTALLRRGGAARGFLPIHEEILLGLGGFGEVTLDFQGCGMLVRLFERPSGLVGGCLACHCRRFALESVVQSKHLALHS